MASSAATTPVTALPRSAERASPEDRDEPASHAREKTQKTWHKVFHRPVIQDTSTAPVPARHTTRWPGGGRMQAPASDMCCSMRGAEITALNVPSARSLGTALEALELAIDHLLLHAQHTKTMR